MTIEVDVILLAWAVTATLAAGYYGFRNTKLDKAVTVLGLTIKAIAKGEATATINNDRIEIRGTNAQSN